MGCVHAVRQVGNLLLGILELCRGAEGCGREGAGLTAGICGGRNGGILLGAGCGNRCGLSFRSGLCRLMLGACVLKGVTGLNNRTAAGCCGGLVECMVRVGVVRFMAGVGRCCLYWSRSAGNGGNRYAPEQDG
jgi:hypothetical protein